MSISTIPTVSHEKPAADKTASAVDLARSGDRRAFDWLVAQYQHMIVSLCTNLLGNRNDGKDAAQDAFAKAYLQLGGYRGEAAFPTWLYAITINTCRNRQQSFWEKLFKRSVLPGIPAHEDDTTEMIEIIDSSPLPSEELEKKELRDQIKRAIMMLPIRYRELIILRDIVQLHYDEIAFIMSVPIDTIKSGIARSRLALQAELRELIDGF